MRHIRMLVVLATGLSLLTVGAGTAAAHTVRADSEVTIRYSDAKERFQGRVSSERPGCERNRRVVVFRDTPGQDVRIGSDRTGDNGFWAVAANNAVGDFYAKVVRRKRTPEGHTHVCRAAVSPTITVEPPGGPS